MPVYQPVQGKTYSLFAENEQTEIFYETVQRILGQFLNKYPDSNLLLNKLAGAMRSKKNYLKWLKEDPMLFELLCEFKPFTQKLNEHLSGLSLRQLVSDRRLGMKEWQYHLGMIEIMLMNRMNKLRFMNCTVKIALLPHCLKDFTHICKSQKAEFDYICRYCSENCYINHISRLLRANRVKPYIWMSTGLKALVRKAKAQGGTLGILGIACIPELVNGINRCFKYGIPVLGIPLNANRCPRWMDDFYSNSVDLEELERIIC